MMFWCSSYLPPSLVLFILLALGIVMVIITITVLHLKKGNYSTECKLASIYDVYDVHSGMPH